MTQEFRFYGLRLSLEEYERLATLAALTGLKRSQVVSRLIHGATLAPRPEAQPTQDIETLRAQLGVICDGQ